MFWSSNTERGPFSILTVGGYMYIDPGPKIKTYSVKTGLEFSAESVAFTTLALNIVS